MKLRDVPALLKKYAAYIYIAVVAGLYLLWRKEKDLHYQAEAEKTAAAERGKADVLKEETKQAEQEASESRADYERLAAPHREGGSD